MNIITTTTTTTNTAFQLFLFNVSPLFSLVLALVCSTHTPEGKYASVAYTKFVRTDFLKTDA